MQNGLVMDASVIEALEGAGIRRLDRTQDDFWRAGDRRRWFRCA
jgi:hypothetical protein